MEQVLFVPLLFVPELFVPLLFVPLLFVPELVAAPACCAVLVRADAEPTARRAEREADVVLVWADRAAVAVADDADEVGDVVAERPVVDEVGDTVAIRSADVVMLVVSMPHAVTVVARAPARTSAVAARAEDRSWN